jgi:hypothetical protein
VRRHSGSGGTLELIDGERRGPVDCRDEGE